MKTIILFALALKFVSATGTQLMEDPLTRGHAPEVVFNPYNVSGTPAEIRLEEKAVVSTRKAKEEDKTEKNPVHIEQLVGYKDHPKNTDENGFVVVHQHITE